ARTAPDRDRDAHAPTRRGPDGRRAAGRTCRRRPPVASRSALRALDATALVGRLLGHGGARVDALGLAQLLDRQLPLLLARVDQREAEQGVRSHRSVAVLVERALEVDARGREQLELAIEVAGRD